MQPSQQQHHIVLQHYFMPATALHPSVMMGHAVTRVTTPHGEKEGNVFLPLLGNQDDLTTIGIQPDEERIFTPEEFRAGAIVLPEPWMVRHLMDHPEAMRDLSHWEYQVYMAALIERKWGHKVELGPRGADDGVDVRAERPGEFGLELMLVQCKHPWPGKPVGIDTVRLLHLQVIKQEATRGLVVTDSRFTRNALQEIQASRYRMEGADGERIRQWLALRTGGPGAQPPS